MKEKPTAIVHGECFAFAIQEIPSGAVSLEIGEQKYLVVADSETTGNHHVVDRPVGVEFLQLGARRFMRNSVPTKIRCLHEDRHDAITLDPGQWEFGTQQEYDPFTANMRNVRD